MIIVGGMIGMEVVTSLSVSMCFGQSIHLMANTNQPMSVIPRPNRPKSVLLAITLILGR